MDFKIEPKSDLSISDNQHLENMIFADLVSFNIYKARIDRQLNELAGKTEIDGNTYYTTLDLHNKLSTAGSPEAALLKDFGFTDETIQSIINFNNDEDLDYLRIAWKYKLLVQVAEFEQKIAELRAELPTGCKLTFKYQDELNSVLINDVAININTGRMLYAMSLSGKINNSSIELIEIPFGETTKHYYDAVLDATAEDLFVTYAGDAEIFEEKYTIATVANLTSIGTGPIQYFWYGFKSEQVTTFEEENNSMFYLYDNEAPFVLGHQQQLLINNPYMWLSKNNARTAKKEVFLRGMSKYTNIDYKVDEGNWFERFISGIVNAFLALVGTLVDLVIAIPVLGDLFKLILDSIGSIFGMDFEEVLIYFKRILAVIITIVIAYYTGMYVDTSTVVAGEAASIGVYAGAAMEMVGMVNSIMSSLSLAEAEWNIIEKEKNKENKKEEDIIENSPDNMMADPDAPDRETDYMFESMFTVPDWGIDLAMESSNDEPQHKFLEI